MFMTQAKARMTTFGAKSAHVATDSPFFAPRALAVLVELRPAVDLADGEPCKPNMTFKMNPKNDKIVARRDAQKTTYSKTRNVMICNVRYVSEFVAQRFLKIDAFLDTIDKL